MIPARVLARADEDIDELADAYAERAGLELGLRFLDAVQRCFEQLSRHPLAGAEQDSLAPRLSGQVFYRPSAEGVEIVRVLRGARDREEELERG